MPGLYAVFKSPPNMQFSMYRSDVRIYTVEIIMYISTYLHTFSVPMYTGLIRIHFPLYCILYSDTN